MLRFLFMALIVVVVTPEAFSADIYQPRKIHSEEEEHAQQQKSGASNIGRIVTCLVILTPWTLVALSHFGITSPLLVAARLSYLSDLYQKAVQLANIFGPLYFSLSTAEQIGHAEKVGLLFKELFQSIAQQQPFTARQHIESIQLMLQTLDTNTPRSDE
jgi:hypothetical protein